jgi:hypothetical protein
MHTPPNGVSARPLITPVMMPVLDRPGRASPAERVPDRPSNSAGLTVLFARDDLIDGLAGAAWPAGARATASPAASETPATAHVILPAAPAGNFKDVCRIGARLLIPPVARNRS